MGSEAYSKTGARRIEVAPDSDLDAEFSDAEYRNQLIELVHGDKRYQLVPLDGGYGDADRAWRKALMAMSLAIRDAQEPLGMTTAQLLREAREELDGE